MSSSPLSGRTSPASTFTSVLFPAPLWPSRPSTSPSARSRSTPASAVTRPYAFASCRARSSAVGCPPPGSVAATSAHLLSIRQEIDHGRELAVFVLHDQPFGEGTAQRERGHTADRCRRHPGREGLVGDPEQRDVDGLGIRSPWVSISAAHSATSAMP